MAVSNLGALRPERTHEELVEMGRKGGIVSGEVRKRRKLLREVLNDLADLPVTDDEVAAYLKQFNLPNTVQYASMLAVLKRALTGDIEAARFFRDTIGEKPTETMQMGIMTGPVKAMDLSKMTDNQLTVLADQVDEAEQALLDTEGRAALPAVDEQTTPFEQIAPMGVDDD